MRLVKILILTNPLNHEGGVVNYYNLFFKHFKSDRFELKHRSIGSRAYLFYYPILKRILYPFFYCFDLLRYIILLLFRRDIKIVQVSPSLIPVPLIRDGLLVVIAKLLGKKVVVFYRGWKLPTYNKIHSNKVLRGVFNRVFQHKTQQVVLASAFKQDLIELNPKDVPEIMLTTTTIDKQDIIVKTNPVLDVVKVLFLGRIQDLKGVGELVDAIILLQKENILERFQFTIVGHEAKAGYVESLKTKLKANGVSSDKVNFTGRITGEEKYEIYAAHHVYVLPSYTEGCPNSLLEALASGLYCITTDVGAMADLVEPGVNGAFVDVKNSEHIKAELLLYANQAKQSNRIEKANLYADRFDIRNITKTFENKYLELIGK